MSRGTQNCWYLILVIVYLDTCQLKRKTNFLLFQEFLVSPAHPCKEEYIIIKSRLILIESDIINTKYRSIKYTRYNLGHIFSLI